jgi:hypothetical protein
MPLLDLDDSRRFSNLSKIWIYFVVSMILTAITFLISTAWEQFAVRLGSPSPVDSSEEQLGINNAHTLEPKPSHKPSTAELLQQVIDVIGAKDNEAHTDDGTTSRSLTAEHDDDEVSNTNGVES